MEHFYGGLTGGQRDESPFQAPCHWDMGSLARIYIGLRRNVIALRGQFLPRNLERCDVTFRYFFSGSDVMLVYDGFPRLPPATRDGSPSEA